VISYCSSTLFIDSTVHQHCSLQSTVIVRSLFLTHSESDSGSVWRLRSLLRPETTGKNSQQLGSRFDLHKSLFGAGTFPVAVQQRFKTHFQPNSSHIRVLETFGVTSELVNWIFLMGFYFCGQYIYTDGDDNKVERDMYVVIPYFRDSNNHDGHER